jgi:flavin reductase (DIM6/NTAB) family NADH-FMN oxidoreductase RutF
MLSVDEFREGCARFTSGVTIATVLAPDGTPHGLTVSSFTPVSLAPPMVLICIDHGCTTLPYFHVSRNFAINVLSEGQRDLSVAFSVKPEGRFEGVSWEPGSLGPPLLHESIAQLECLRSQIVTVGDHDILVGEVVAVRTFPGEPLVYYHRNYRSLL